MKLYRYHTDRGHYIAVILYEDADEIKYISFESLPLTIHTVHQTERQYFTTLLYMGSIKDAILVAAARVGITEKARKALEEYKETTP